jgi:hypothetical protein
MNLLRFLPCLLAPTGRLAQAVPVRPVREALPCWAAGFRRVRPPVVGLPHRRVLRSLRLPNGLGRAFPWPVLLRLPRPGCVTARRFPPGAGSGLPLPGRTSGRPSTGAAPVQARLGAPTGCDASRPACHGLRTPADRAILASARLVLGGLRWACTPSASATSAFAQLFQPCRGRGHPCGLPDTLATLRPSCASCVPPPLRHGRKTRWKHNRFMCYAPRGGKVLMSVGL